MYGELIPDEGGDPIPLLKASLMVGRRESCDIVLRFGNVSGQHCELSLDRGWWFVKDLNSQNGTRVNGIRVSKKRLDPGDRLTIARLDYEIRYSPVANGGDESAPPEDDVFADIMGRSLLESAGLDRRKLQERDGRIGARRKGAGGEPAGPAEAAAQASAAAGGPPTPGAAPVVARPASSAPNDDAEPADEDDAQHEESS